ncbi:molybdopterin-dependent oxidoreductase [Nannocystis punicea]|uniref:Molybdopterin-dependent oxidoreductase n=1 Tax=Nannocystis punicea TaxID=2995304 RepID=A0ABY7GYJ8_9BACT|nr:molybdopterin-dependent oxidoreductase [Nannocystis poenicansa]WAS92041.1 molybdopterin-dependent oxidoreductase [Nannocystis poenicansa]
MRIHPSSRRQFLALASGSGLTAALACTARAPGGQARGGGGAELVKALPDEWFIRHGTHNAETRLEGLPVGQLVTPIDRFYVRNHGPTPRLSAADWRLEIHGDGVERPVSVTYDQLVTLPSVTITRYLECAGNGRAFFKELLGAAVEGDPWRDGAYGVAKWTGVPLATLLGLAGLRGGAAWVMPVSLDGEGYARPMPLAKAMTGDTILAHRMNGEALPMDHGFPARVVVPGWIGAASVKWVGALEVSAQEPAVEMNTEEYVFLGADYPKPPPVLTTGVVKSAVCLPWPALLPAGRRTIHGLAWSPFGAIDRVDISLDGGGTFTRAARLVGDNLPVAGTWWQLELDATPGAVTITPRAVDEHGHTQPPLSQQLPNDKGYLFAAPVPHPIHFV